MIKRRVQRSTLPKCVGLYTEGDKECDGAPCSWRVACKIYRDRAEKRAIQIGSTRSSVVASDVSEFGLKTIERHLWDLESKHYSSTKTNPLFGFNLFVDGVKSVTSVAERSSDARSGDCFFTSAPSSFATGFCYDYPFARTLHYMIVKGKTQSRDVTVPIAEYTVRVQRKFWPPLISFAMDLETIMTHYPGVMGGAMAWRSHRKTRWTLASRVAIKRIPDLGRMAGTAVKEGHTMHRLDGHYGDMTRERERKAKSDRARFIERIRNGKA